MAETSTLSTFLGLPWELRRPIIVEVLKCGRESEPIFDQELIKNRMRLRNCFDKKFPETTNIYVPKHRNLYLHGNALQATNRQLRREAKQVLAEEMNSGNVESPFVLDIMIVKDVGVFPTWMSFPYQPKHLKTLRINLRIIRTGTSTIPNDWIEVARYKAGELFDIGSSPALWSILVTIVLYSLGCFSTRAGSQQTLDGTSERKESLHPQILNEEANGAQRPNPELGNPRLGILQDLVDHHSDMVDAYFVTSASYITDELLVVINKYENDTAGNPICPNVEAKPKRRTFSRDDRVADRLPIIQVEDSEKESRFYKEGYIQFGRELFHDYIPRWDDRYWCNSSRGEREQYEIRKGEYASYLLDEELGRVMCHAQGTWHGGEVHGPCLRVLGSNVRDITTAYEKHSNIIERISGTWTYTNWKLCRDHLRYSSDEATMEQDWTEEMTCDCLDKGLMESLRVYRNRRQHGWLA